MKKQFAILLILVVVLAVLCLPVTAHAATTADGFGYSISKGCVTITGYEGTAADVVIPATIDGYPVTRVYDRAFKDCEILVSVEIPDSVTDIGTSAFDGCVNLETIRLSNKITEIGVYTFRNCSALKEITIPDGVTNLYTMAFCDCSNLKTVTIPDSVTKISNRAFAGCVGLTDVYMGNSVTEIGEYAFSSCSGLTSIELPNTLNTLGSHAFRGCTSLNQLTVPDSVTKLGDGIVAGCSSLEKLSVPFIGESIDQINNRVQYPFGFFFDVFSFEGGYKISQYTISGDTHSKQSYYLPEMLKEVHIGGGDLIQGTFENCTSLETITFDANIPQIPKNFFKNCSGLKNVTVNGVETIGYYAFMNCTSLQQFTIADTVRSIDHQAFAGCSALKTVSIPDCVTELGSGAFQDCEALTSIKLPSKIKEVPSAVCNRCTSLQSVNIPQGVTVVASESFRNCTSLNKVIIHNGVTELGGMAFAGCSNLEEIWLPGDLTCIWYSTFKDCNKLKTVIYTGTKAQRDIIYNGTGNDTLFNAQWSYKEYLLLQNNIASTDALNGMQISFKLTATGEGLTYRWYYKNKGESKFSVCTEFTGNTYSVKINSACDGRQVYCVITDEFGNTVKTKTATLSMAQPAKITKQPANVRVFSGENATVKVTATGNDLSYKWYYKDKGTSKFTLASSQKGNSYTAAMSKTCDGRQVYCVITDKYGTKVTSSTVTLSMAIKAKITKQPANARVFSGKNATAKVTAAGDSLTYKWYYKDKSTSKFTLAASVKGNSYTIAMNKARDGRQVYCVITDKYGNSVTSKTVTLSMAVKAKITKQPAMTVVPNGKKATVKVTVVGDGLTYKWYYKNKSTGKFSVASSVKGNSYAIKMNKSRSGRQVYCVITDKYGNQVKTKTVTLYMGRPAKITKQPAAAENIAGKKVTVSVKATGDGLTYRWYYKNKGATKFTASAVTGRTYSVKMNNARNGQQVYCVVKDKYGSKVQTQTVILSMAQQVKITSQPQSVSVAVGQPAIVAFKAEGDGLTYKWYYKNKGASKFTYTAEFQGPIYMEKMTNAMNGRQVYCVVTDKYGYKVKTNVITIKKATGPKITKQPSDIYAVNGDAASFSVTAEGVGLTYEWYYRLPGHTYFTYTGVSAVTLPVEMCDELAGMEVYCIVKDSAGHSITSDTATFCQREPDIKMSVMKGFWDMTYMSIDGQQQHNQDMGMMLDDTGRGYILNEKTNVSIRFNLKFSYRKDGKYYYYEMLVDGTPTYLLILNKVSGKITIKLAANVRLEFYSEYYGVK